MRGGRFSKGSSWSRLLGAVRQSEAKSFPKKPIKYTIWSPKWEGAGPNQPLLLGCFECHLWVYDPHVRDAQEVAVEQEQHCSTWNTCQEVERQQQTNTCQVRTKFFCPPFDFVFCLWGVCVCTMNRVPLSTLLQEPRHIHLQLSLGGSRYMLVAPWITSWRGLPCTRCGCKWCWEVHADVNHGRQANAPQRSMQDRPLAVEDPS